MSTKTVQKEKYIFDSNILVTVSGNSIYGSIHFRIFCDGFWIIMRIDGSTTRVKLKLEEPNLEINYEAFVIYPRFSGATCIDEREFEVSNQVMKQTIDLE